jgi:hypothetical protein
MVWRATPTSQIVIVIFLKIEKPSPTIAYLMLSFIPSWEIRTLRAHICVQRSAVHPSILEEVEGYKNNFFLKIPDLIF